MGETGVQVPPDQDDSWKRKPDEMMRLDIGKREIVGFGMTGMATYIDSVKSPYPAIRFKEDNAEISVLREKEKGDWKKLTNEEKKTLYRASFASTFEELEANDGEWKSILGIVMIGMGLSTWMYLGIRYRVLDMYNDEQKEKASAEYRDKETKEIMQRMVDEKIGIIDGFSSKYDYDNKKWKD